jgi:hypothetical protein
MQLKVIKADGTQEEYLHTKVMTCLVNAFACLDEAYLAAATELADTVTFYLYIQHDRNEISSGEIFSIIQAVLSSTGYDFAAENILNHRLRRNLLRTRIEVTKFDAKNCAAAKTNRIDLTDTTHWNKSKIVYDLQSEQKLDAITARTIASMAEEKIINSELRNFTTDFIKFLVISQMQAIISAQRQLGVSAKAEKLISEYTSATDSRLRQSQNGLCFVEA